MCGRFTHLYKWSDLHRLMRLTTGPDDQQLKLRYNVAPSNDVPVVRQDSSGNRTAALLRWGLVPFWADDPKIGNRLINARSEEAASKPAFRAAVKKRRCLIPVSGFFEWQTIAGRKVKQPWLLRVKGVPLFALAGLWERWDKGEQPLETFTILTGSPNELVAPIHNRMPVIVKPEDYDSWLDPQFTEYSQLESVLQPFPASQMEAVKISTRVNSPANDDASVLEPLKQDG